MSTQKSGSRFTRRSVLKGASAVAAAALLPRVAHASIASTVTQGTMTANIPSDFMGIGFEKFRMNDSYFASGSKLAPLLNLLTTQHTGASGVVRLGGDKTNIMGYGPSASVPTTAQKAAGITFNNNSVNVDTLNTFLGSAGGWKCIYALNHAGCFNGQYGSLGASGYAADSWTQTKNEASYVATKLGAALYQFEIGNEPDQYGITDGAQQDSPTDWDDTYGGANYNTQWTSMYNTLKNYSTKIGGPVGGDARVSGDTEIDYKTGRAKNTGMNNWVGKFKGLSGGDYLLQHFYNNVNSSNPNAILAYPNTKLVGDGTTNYCLPYLSSLGQHFRMSECNSVLAGGQPGFSNLFASALWALDLMYACASWGCQGVNFTAGGTVGAKDWYTPLSFDSNGIVDSVNPLFYGMMFFQMAGYGTILKCTTNFQGYNGSAFIVQPGDATSQRYLVLVNKETSHDFAVTATLASSYTINSAQSLKMSNTGGDFTVAGNDPNNPGTVGTTTIGGAQLYTTANWSNGGPQWSSSGVTFNGNTVSVTVPAESAVMVRLNHS